MGFLGAFWLVQSANDLQFRRRLGFGFNSEFHSGRLVVLKVCFVPVCEVKPGGFFSALMLLLVVAAMKSSCVLDR